MSLKLHMIIETLRCRLILMAEQRGLGDHRVIRLSQRLDQYIAQAMKSA
ncbi:MAG: aspartyl-phosphate phosphatase Spo0E family protein [Thermacetogeniaceae bacterium]